MKIKTIISASILAMLLAPLAAADHVREFLNQHPVLSLPAGDNIITSLQAAKHDPDAMSTQFVNIKGMHFEKALLIETKRTPPFVQNLNLYINNSKTIKKGDVLFLTLWVKCIASKNDTGQGLIAAAFQKNYQNRLFEHQFDAGPTWTRIYTKAVSPIDFPAGAAALRFAVGYRPQTILIADIKLLNFEQNLKADDLPKMPIDYDGVAPDAQWRKEAIERIEKYRKSDLTITVTDKNSNPVTDARVHVKMTKNAFAFGGTYRAKMHLPNNPFNELETFQENFKLLFNKAVFPNALKWKQYNYSTKQASIDAYDWLKQNDIDVRGHTLVWPGWNFLPKELKKYENNPDAIRRLTAEHIKEMLTDWKSKITDWDVVNEVYRQHDLLDICGKDILIEWFKLARKIDPKTKLYYNDANILVNHQPAHLDHCYSTIQWLLETGATIDGMGFQCHVHSLVPPKVTYDRINYLSKLGPEIQITEFDIQVPGISDQMQATYARDFLIAVFSHPKTVGVTTWLGGNPLREDPRNTDRAQCAFYYNNWTPKPIAKVWLELKNKTWNTNLIGKTNDKGSFKTRAFQGTYEITIKKDTHQKTITTTIDTKPKSIKIQL